MSNRDQTGVTATRAGPLTMVGRKPFLLLVWESNRRVSVPARPILAQPLSIGRSSSCSIPLRDPQCSRQHATVWHRADGVRIEDQSRNGTFVDGVRIRGGSTLADGDLVRVGDSFFVVLSRDPTPPEDVAIEGLDGDAEGMVLLRRAIAAVAPTNARVLILGETGTGKEATARAVHTLSGRKGPFVPVNCAAIPEGLAESQLFGHVRGAFTDAHADHAGFFRAAHGGTLFLDEVGELAPALQAKLLRVLEAATVLPVGGTREHAVQVRVVAATHRDLGNEIDSGRFRGDLYARLAEYTLRTISLRAHREDILPLLERFLGPSAPPMSPDLVGAILGHPYRFNVRELSGLARQLLVDGGHATRLEIFHGGGRLDAQSSPTLEVAEIESSVPREPAPTRERLAELLRQSSGNVSEVARTLGRSRRQIHRYLETYGLDLDSYRA